MAHWQKILLDGRIVKRGIMFEGKLIGNVMCWYFDDEPNISYWLDKAYWGRGFATEALRAFLDIHKERPLYGRAAADNHGSIRVLEKCGFVMIGHEISFANGRNAEIKEVILKLEAAISET